MKKLIYNTAASEGGAIAILRFFHQQALRETHSITYFVVGNIELEESSCVKVITLAWAKKSKVLRLFCEYFYMPFLIRLLAINHVISLQNTALPFCPVLQTVYMHNCLPFIKQRFDFHHNRTLWINQNIAGYFMKSAIRRADELIVQTHWMKCVCQEAVPIPTEKFIVQTPEINYAKIVPFQEKQDHFRTFFYPASGMIFKNHQVIVDACELLLQQKGIPCYRVIFTLTGNENEKIRELYDKVKKLNLPIIFMGKLELNEVFQQYSKSVLLFPSYAETCGLPLLEAKATNAPILSADWEVPREVLEEYDKVKFFAYNDAKALSELMADLIWKTFA